MASILPTESRDIASLLAQLLKFHVIGSSTLIEVAHGLSHRGLHRREIVDFFYLLSVEFESELSEEQSGMIGDVTGIIAGENCPIEQIVRFQDDPSDAAGMAERVYQEMKGWTRPSAWPPRS